MDGKICNKEKDKIGCTNVYSDWGKWFFLHNSAFNFHPHLINFTDETGM